MEQTSNQHPSKKNCDPNEKPKPFAPWSCSFSKNNFAFEVDGVTISYLQFWVFDGDELNI